MGGGGGRGGIKARAPPLRSYILRKCAEHVHGASPSCLPVGLPSLPVGLLSLQALSEGGQLACLMSGVGESSLGRGGTCAVPCSLVPKPPEGMKENLDSCLRNKGGGGKEGERLYSFWTYSGLSQRYRTPPPSSTGWEMAPIVQNLNVTFVVLCSGFELGCRD